MATNFAIVGIKDSEKTIESIRQFDGVSCVSIVPAATSLNKVLEKNSDYLVICEAGDTFDVNYIPTCINFLEVNRVIGGVYSDYTLNKNRVLLPSFCRQRLVRGIFKPPINCILRRNLLEDGFFKEEIFLDFTDKYAMYHIAEALVHKNEYTDSNS